MYLFGSNEVELTKDLHNFKVYMIL